MVKTVVSAICVAIIILFGSIIEMNFIHKQFGEFHQVVEILYEKVDDHVAVEEDVYAVQKNWLNKKSYLHAFIPHNEIKEVDLWLSETVTLVRDEKWEDAISKLEVLKELAEQIPKTFSLTLANVF